MYNLTDVKLGKIKDLTGADFSGENLFGANLSGTNFAKANLSRANLSRSIFFKANLTKANLFGADLSNSDFSAADLSYADFRSTNLQKTYLYGVNLTGAILPPPQMFLLASWGPVSKDLCRKLMAYDAQSHPNPEFFNAWKKTGTCPYFSVNIQRACNFYEDPSLWDEILLDLKLNPYELMIELFKQNHITF